MNGQRVGRRTRIATALVTLPVILVAAVVFWPRSGDPTEVGAFEHAAQHGAVTSDAGDGTSSAGAGVVLVPPSQSSVGSQPETSLGEAAGADPSGPTRDGASGLGPPRAAIDPDAIVPSSGSLGGCLPEYGADGQCLSTIPPSQASHAQQMRDAGLDPREMDHTWTCSELRLSFPEGVAVRTPGNDPQMLDADHDGVACGPGD